MSAGSVSLFSIHHTALPSEGILGKEVAHAEGGIPATEQNITFHRKLITSQRRCPVARDCKPSVIGQNDDSAGFGKVLIQEIEDFQCPVGISHDFAVLLLEIGDARGGRCADRNRNESHIKM